MLRTLAILVALLSVTAGSARDPLPAEAGLEHLREGDLRVATVVYRLAAANAELCRDVAPLTGLIIHDALQYNQDYRPAAIRLFGLGDRPGIMAIVPGSPAERAGFRPNDMLLAIGGVPVAAGPSRTSEATSYQGVADVLEQLDSALAKGSVTLEVRRGEERVSLLLTPVIGCASRSQLIPDDKKDAGADGRMISITTALADYTQSDDELAVILGHEMAHNVLRHRLKLKESGIARGLLSHFGKNATAIRATEREADHVGLYMMARAGFDITAAPAFWRRYGRATDLGIFSDPTHPRWRERERELLSAIDAIHAKRARGEPLVP